MSILSPYLLPAGGEDREHRASRRYAVLLPTAVRASSERIESQLRAHFQRRLTLEHWAIRQGIKLSNSPEDLREVEILLSSQGAGRSSFLDIELGLFLGSILIEQEPTTHWTLLDNGYPVIRLTPEMALDVILIGREHISTGRPGLTAVFKAATDHSPSRPLKSGWTSNEPKVIGITRR